MYQAGVYIQPLFFIQSTDKYFAITPKNTSQHYKVIEKLHEVFPLTEVPTDELCDFILVFPAADEIKAVPEMLSCQPGTTHDQFRAKIKAHFLLKALQNYLAVFL